MVNVYVWSRILFVSSSGFIFGYDVGSINGVKNMKGYRQAFNPSYHYPSMLGGNSSDAESCDSQDDVDTSAILGLIVSLFSVGSLIGALLSGVLSDFVGRKPAIVIGASLVAVGGVLHTGAVHIGMILLSRIISGIGVGVLYQATPLYVGEISPERLRGRMLTLFSMDASIGFVVGTVVNLIVKDYIFGWRISLSVQFVTGTILALGTLLLPRSPRWLVKKCREDEAQKILSKIYKDEERARNLILEIKSAVTSTKEPFRETLKYVCHWKIIQRLLLGFFVLFLGRFAGGNFVAYFSVTIFCSIGLPGFAVSIALAISGSLPIILSLTIIDKLGRKLLFLLGLTIMLISIVLSASLILAFDLESSNDLSASQRVAGYFVLILMCLFMASFNVSCGNIPWIIVGEIFPLRGRGFLISICNTGYWLGIIIMNQIGPILISSPLRISGTILLISGFILLLLVYILLFLPETKGHSLEDMEKLFSKPWLKRTNVIYYLRCGCFWDLIVKRRTRVEQSEETQRLEISMDQISLSSSSSSDEEKDKPD